MKKLRLSCFTAFTVDLFFMGWDLYGTAPLTGGLQDLVWTIPWLLVGGWLSLEYLCLLTREPDLSEIFD